jgi:hypothetical protein
MKLLLTIFSVCWITIGLPSQDPCDFEISIPPDINLEPGQSIQLDLLTSVLPEVIQSIVWTPSTFLSCSDCFSPIAMPPQDICYYVTVTDTTNCSITDSLCIFVGITNSTIPPDQAVELTIFPNPASAILNIHTVQIPFSEVRFFDITGHFVASRTFPSQTTASLKVDHFPRGIYYLEIRFANHTVHRKILLE